MASTFFGIDIASSGMKTYQTSLNTTAHNLANVGTKGYSRQTANLSASLPLESGSTYGMIGTGVDVLSITRQRNEYYDTKYRISCSVQAQYETQSYYLNCIDRYFYSADSDTKTASIPDTFDQLYTSITDLTSDPTDETKRTQVVEDSVSLTEQLNNTANYLQKLQAETNTQIANTVKEINSLAERICSLTKQINSLEVFGGTANDLRDQRGVLLDDLSAYCNIETKEIEPSDGVGYNQFYVYVNGEVLVDTTIFNSLTLQERQEKVNDCDADGLYDLSWSNGQPFNIRSSKLGGTLQALFEVRDGNNGENFTGKANGVKGDKTLTVTGANCEDFYLLNIPASDGKIESEGLSYRYESFDVAIDADGNYTYTFHLKEELKRDVTDEDMKIGDAVDKRGVPYYMSQINQFVRTFSSRFNEVHNAGYDAKSKAGLDYFNIVSHADEDLSFTEEKTNFTFSSVLKRDADGNVIPGQTANYYWMTGLNINVNSEIRNDCNLIACKGEAGSGDAEKDNITALMKLKDDTKMFLHGTPDSFLQVLTSSVAVDSGKAETFSKSQTNILKAIDNQRTSVSGVDEDEEGADLVKFQNLLFNQYKVLSVMDEVFNKLINETAV